MNAHKNPWDEDYQLRGRLWGGRSSTLPHVPQSSRILELGCGNGKTTASLVQAGCSVTAIDLSPHAASLCHKTCPDVDRLGILIADCRTTPFRNETFDVIMASHIVGHLTCTGRRQLAQEIFRLLASEGTVHFCDFSKGDFRYGRGLETEEGTFTRQNGIMTHYFTTEEVKSLFAGLAVQSLIQRDWEMRIRGMVYPRAEIVAEFKKYG